jgi:hypothetical protein
MSRSMARHAKRALQRYNREKSRAKQVDTSGVSASLARLRKLHADGRCQGRHKCPVCMITFIRATNS